MRVQLRHALSGATAHLLQAKRLARLPENQELLDAAAKVVGQVMLSEGNEPEHTAPKPSGHHGG